MALTILSRPQGHIADMVTSYAGVASSSGGSVLITYTSHGLSTGDFVFVDCNLSAYNGYWYVQKNDNDSFFIREYATASNQAFVNSGTATYYKCVLNHNWNAVHLPIIYKMSNDRWPTNSVDTVRTVSSISNDSGYVNLNLSGDIKATGTAAELEYVQVFGQNAGIYQIINWISDSDITIDMPYNAGVSFSASTVQYYYNNYHARVKLYAGLNASHYWAGQKPYELIGEFKFVPDADGIIQFNVAEYIKEKIEIDSNNLALDTFPNDINSFTQFYITYAEAYDYSTGYTLGTSVSSYTDDSGTYEGYAVNAMLPFKTQSGGFMDEYVSGLTANTAQKFLTPFDRPSIFENQYFDLAFIINSSASGFYILEQYYVGNSLLTTTQTNITDNDAGIYRHQVTYFSSADTVRVSLYNSANLLLSEIKIIDIDTNCFNNSTDLCWKNNLGGNDYWRFGAGKEKSIKTKKKQTETNYFTQWPKSWGKHADKLMKNSMVEGFEEYRVRSQYVDLDKADGISGIHTALTVQEITSRNDRREVIVDDGSFNIFEETDKLVEITFKMRYTDDKPMLKL